ncbi:MAG: hypothetical protein R6W68_16270 [Ignavibacteriaceae bacterium]
MKKLFVFAGVLFMLAIFGCQENQVTDPLVSAINKTEALPSGQWISLNSPLLDPTSGQCILKGSVYCNLKEYVSVSYPAITEDVPSRYLLRIIIDAELCNVTNIPFNRNWIIKNESTFRFTLKPDEVITIHKSYPIANREDVMLIVKYDVAVKGVSIASMYLCEI